MAAERDYYEDALDYTELPLDLIIEQRPQTAEERREYLLGRVAIEYVKCVELGEHDAKAWNRLSRWLYDLVAIQEELSHDKVAR